MRLTAPSGIQDVARAAGVSTATVSRALRGLDRVSPQTRARVVAAATELRYVASPTAASLKSGKTGVIAVVVPYLTRWFFAHLIDGAQSRLSCQGYRLLVVNIGDRGAHRARALDHNLLAKRVDGILVLSADLDPPEVAQLHSLAVPIVTVGLDLPGCDRVGIDDVDAADIAMSHLLGLGHRRIAYVGGDPAHDVHIATAVQRRKGVRRALRRAGVDAEPGLFSYGDWTVRGGIDVGRRLLERPDPPTAVLAASDEMAIGVLCAARVAGVRVPDELSVMGIDDHELAFTHELTTVRQSVTEQGATAAELLLQWLNGTQAPQRQTLVLPTELVRRASTASPPARSPSRQGKGTARSTRSRAPSPEIARRAARAR